jgi:peptidoglycan/LPS O-acetylase OafA/YrhL
MADKVPRRLSPMRPEIQALRAFAVLAVVVYHLWPDRLAGGFVGVDIFFAISGFLITAHLMREATLTGRISLPRFWARRARRLLPASLLVIATSALATLLWVPTNLWEAFFREIGAAALYVENWALAADSVDYLANENVASPVQHFWSLSAEEQFYIALPILIVLTLLATFKLRMPRRTLVIGAVLAAVTVASFVWSVVQVQAEPASAYFVTPTRAWEFLAGGLLALVAPHARVGAVAVRTAVSWLGWGMLVAAALLYSNAIPFPGVPALLPVLGVVAVIWAGSDDLKYSVNPVARLRPIQFVGDISYSMYLWHWPLIVLLPYALDAENTDATKWGILAASILLGWASKKLVEDPVRTGGLARVRPRYTLIATAAAMAIVVFASGTGVNAVQNQAAADIAMTAELIAADTPCFGAAAMDPENQPCVNPDLATTVIPALMSSTKSTSPTWDECHARTSEARECVLGTEGGTRVLVVGDSHAHHWISAIESLAASEGWEIHMFVRGRCSFNDADWDRNSGSLEKSCTTWNDNVDAAVAAQDPFEYVFTSLRVKGNQTIHGSDETSPETTTAALAEAGFASAWNPMIERGATIVAIHDNPRSGQIKKCVRQNPDDLELCRTKVGPATSMVDWLYESALEIPGVIPVDLTDYFCGDEFCQGVIGGVLVVRDDHHLTTTYAETLAPYLLRAMEDAQR